MPFYFWKADERKWEFGELWWLQESKWTDVKRSEPLPASSARACVCVTHCQWISDEVSRSTLCLSGEAIFPKRTWHFQQLANLEMMDTPPSALLCLKDGAQDLLLRCGTLSWRADWIWLTRNLIMIMAACATVSANQVSGSLLCLRRKGSELNLWIVHFFFKCPFFSLTGWILDFLQNFGIEKCPPVAYRGTWAAFYVFCQYF